MLINLMKNNLNYWKIYITLDEKILLFKNTGYTLKTLLDHLFNRFNKDAPCDY